MSDGRDRRDHRRNFDLLGDWDQRYQYLVEIGERLPPMPAADKTEANRVKECMSMVHMAVHPEPAGRRRLHFTGDCDTAIIKGVVAILVRLFSGKTPAEIEAIGRGRPLRGAPPGRTPEPQPPRRRLCHRREDGHQARAFSAC